MSSNREDTVLAWLHALDCQTSDQAAAALHRLIAQTDQWRWDLLELSKQVAGASEAGLAEHARQVAQACDALYWHLTFAATALRDAS